VTFPKELWEISFLLAAIAIVLLVSSELLSSYSGKITVLVNKKRLRFAAVGVTIAFLVTVALKIVEIIS